MSEHDEFPCSLTIDIPFPTHRLASAALRTLSVDQELSPLVRRHFCLTRSSDAPQSAVADDPFRASISTNAAPQGSVDAVTAHAQATTDGATADAEAAVLRTFYRATTNRMLRVAVNGFFESMGVVLQVMEELDVDVIQENGLEDLEGVQGVEQGMTGSTITGG
ncbi:hypothetical protein MBLNU459_g1013t1 [Dothideomycetes sp. NU459]